MAGHIRPSVGPERLDDQIRTFNGHIQETAFAGGQVMSHGPFVHMPEVVKLVAVPDVIPGLVDVAAGDIFAVFFRPSGPCGIKITIRLLCGGNIRNDFIQVFIQLRIRMNHQAV